MNGGGWIGLQKEIDPYGERDRHRSQVEEHAIEGRMRQGRSLGRVAINPTVASRTCSISQRDLIIVEIVAGKLQELSGSVSFIGKDESRGNRYRETYRLCIATEQARWT